MAVPAGHIVHQPASQHLKTVPDVFEDLQERSNEDADGILRSLCERISIPIGNSYFYDVFEGTMKDVNLGTSACVIKNCQEVPY